MAIKALILLTLGRLFRLSTDQNLIFSFSLNQMGEFAFVLLSFSLAGGILPQETVSLFIAVVTISMLLTPLIMLLNERLVLPHIGTKEAVEKAPDHIDEKNPVIIAGFGNFGSTIGRFLRANKINATYLDVNSDRVDALRRMGFKVFYGDASRHELLHAAGADEAKIIIIAIDHAKKRAEMIETIRKHFPHLHIMSRARNRQDAYHLMNMGIINVYRETIDTSLRLGVDAMRLLGWRAYTAKRLARTFMRHDEEALKRMASVDNQEEYITKARKYIEEIELIIQNDAEGPMLKDSGFESEAKKEDHH
jgi:voltage-gated potassium channel Kch